MFGHNDISFVYKVCLNFIENSMYMIVYDSVALVAQCNQLDTGSHHFNSKIQKLLNLDVQMITH